MFRTGRLAFLLNPPAEPATDTDVEERATVAAIVAALDASGLEKVVAQSTYGAQPRERCGDLTVLHELEQALVSQPIPAAILRAGYYMTNWDSLLPTMRDEGILPTLFPADLELPMVAPEDCGLLAAGLLTEPANQTGLTHVEGRRCYTPADVAAAFAQALGRPVEVQTAPRETWERTFRDMGFSDPAASSYTRMTEATVDAEDEFPDAPERGSVTLEAHIDGSLGDKDT